MCERPFLALSERVTQIKDSLTEYIRGHATKGESKTEMVQDWSQQFC